MRERERDIYLIINKIKYCIMVKLIFLTYIKSTTKKKFYPYKQVENAI